MRTGLPWLLMLTLLLSGCFGGSGGLDTAASEKSAAGSFVPYLQQGVDAGRTGATSDPGPETFDLAFQLNLPGTRWREVVPVILNGSVYVLTAQETSGIWRIDLDTGREELIVDFTDVEDYWMSTFFSDGRRLFVGGGNEITAFSTNGGAVWTYTFPQATMVPPRATNCMPGAFEAGIVYLGCTQVATATDLQTPIRQWTDTAVLAVALDAVNGEEIWRSVLYPGEGALEPDLEYRPRRDLVRTALGPENLFVESYEDAPSRIDGNLESGPQLKSRHVIWAFDRNDGALTWNWNVPAHSGDPEPGPVAMAEAADRDFREYVDMGMVATPDALYVKADSLHALDPEDGSDLWELPLYQEGETAEQGYALAFFDDDLYVTSHAHLYRVDADAQTIKWSVRAAPGDHWDDAVDLLVANGAVYGVTNFGRLSIYDIEDGSVLHQHRIGTEQTSTDAYVIAVGQEVVVASRLDGELLVFGRPEAAIHPSLEISGNYPAPGENVWLDVSATRRGALADDLEFQVNWGDGRLTDWQEDPVFTHSYVRAGDHTATLRARNSAGQEGTETIVFHVGAQPPREPTFLENAFARDNQDLTFGVLGLAVAFGGGLIALGWRQTRRSRLQRELRAVDRTFQQKKHVAPECEQALQEHKNRCRGLLMTGRLEEPQFAILEHRIDELCRTLRTGALEEQLDFLPHGLVNALRDMLSDSRVSAWEREHVLRALDEDEVLTKRQKQKVRAQVDQWFERDKGVQG